MGKTRPQPVSDGCDVMVLGHTVVVLAIVIACALMLSWLFKPTVLANPAVAAYTPPVGTLLLPPPRKMDAPELAELSPLTSLAQAFETAKPPPPKAEERKPVRKRPKPRETQDPAASYAQQWNDRPWNERPWGGEDRRWNDDRRRGYDRQWNDGGRFNDGYRQSNGGYRPSNGGSWF